MKRVLVSLIVLLCIFFIPSFVVLDPDFGLHIASGQFILKHGIPKTDPFSYTMPSYPFIYHEWLAAVIVATLYPLIGFAGLGILFALLPVSAFALQINLLPKSIRSLSFVPLLLTGTAILPFTGIRLQLITWLFFSLLLWILNAPSYQKWRWVLPPLFLLWANLHGGFSLGLAFLFMFLVIQSITKKSLLLSDVLLAVASFLATCATPYGPGIWSVVWAHAASSTNYTIPEWQSPLSSFSFLLLEPCLWVYVEFSLVLIVYYRKSFSFLSLLTYSLPLLAGFISIRNMPLWLIASLPMTTTAFSYLIRDMKRLFEAQKLHKITSLLYLTLGIIIVIQLLLDRFPTYPHVGDFYPKQAVAFLTRHPSHGQLFSIYGWGGYLDWKLPEKKVFIDGRMPSWSWNAPNSHEENNAAQTYIDLGLGKIQFKTLADKYGIDTVLLPSEKKTRKPVYQTEGLFLQKEADIPAEVQGYGMKKIYEDSVAVVYRN